MNERYRALLELYAQQSLGVRLYVRWRLALGLLEAERFDVLLPKEGLIVDFGAGYGVLTNYLSLKAPGRRLLGIDADPARMRVAQATAVNRRNVEFRCDDVLRVDLPPLRGAIMTDFLHHLSVRVQDRLLSSVAARLEPGGRLLVRDVNPLHDPRWKYWCSVVADVVLYPDPRTTKLQNRRPADLMGLLSSLGLRVEMSRADARSPFAAVLYVAERSAG